MFLWILPPRACRAFPVPLASVPCARGNLLRPLRASLFESSSRQATMLRPIHIGAFCTILGKFVFKVFTCHSEHSAKMSACFAHAQLLFPLFSLLFKPVSSVQLTSEGGNFMWHSRIQFTPLILPTFLLSLSRGVPLDVQRAPNSVGFTNYISHAHLNDP